jgi:hypothetical protein
LWVFREHKGRTRLPSPLTGWNIGDIRRTMNIETASAPIEKQWYQRLWSN